MLDHAYDVNLYKEQFAVPTQAKQKSCLPNAKAWPLGFSGRQHSLAGHWEAAQPCKTMCAKPKNSNNCITFKL
jgi:hypothetical protein